MKSFRCSLLFPLWYCWSFQVLRPLFSSSSRVQESQSVTQMTMSSSLMVLLSAMTAIETGYGLWLPFCACFHFLYAAALRHKEKYLSDSVQRALCGAFEKEGIYWGVVTSIFRLVMSMIFTAIRDVPSTAALIQLFLCVAISFLMIYQNPYREATTYRFDILCYAVLTIQFGLTVLVSVSQSLGVSTSENNFYFATLKRSAVAITYLRYVLRCLMLSFLLNFVVVSCFALGRYVTFIVGTTLWLYLHRTTICNKISFSYRSLKGYGKACFSCFTRCKYRQSSAHGAQSDLLWRTQLAPKVVILWIYCFFKPFKKLHVHLSIFCCRRISAFKAATWLASRYSRLSEYYQSIAFKINPPKGLQWSHDTSWSSRATSQVISFCRSNRNFFFRSRFAT